MATASRRGYRYPVSRHGRVDPRRRAVRRLGLVALVAASMLGVTFAFGLTVGRNAAPDGQSLVAGSPSREAGAGQAGSAARGVPRDRPEPATVPPARDPLAGPDGATAGRLGPEYGGPHGARQTTGSPAVALTFDDGPNPNYTPQVLALLGQYDIKATFCLIGENVRQHPELVRDIVAAGHTLCNHSWSHDTGLGGRPEEQIRADLVRTSQAIWDAVPGAPIAYYRQPGGNWTDSAVAVADSLGMTALGWAVDPRDWTRPGVDKIVSAVTGNAFPGSIVLLHDGGGDRTQTMGALHTILPDLTRRLALVPLPDVAHARR